MQQTTSREFSIIESSDPFLPEALNDNTRKIEAALDAHETQTKAVTDALAARITALEGHKFACGYYIGDSAANRVIPLSFTPTAGIVQNLSNRSIVLGVTGQEYPAFVKPVANGLLLMYNSGNPASEVNYNGYRYVYLAFC